MLRPAQARDRDAVLAWRNHPDVRSVSLTDHVITPHEHAAWWSRTLPDPTRCVLIYERGGVPSGTVSFFDITDEGGERSAWWGFFLDVNGLQDRGQLLPAWLEVMREAVDYGVDDLRLDVLHGEVLAENEGVRAGNRRVRIRETGTEERVIGGRSRTVVRLELRADDVHARRAVLAGKAAQLAATGEQRSNA